MKNIEDMSDRELVEVVVGPKAAKLLSEQYTGPGGGIGEMYSATVFQLEGVVDESLAILLATAFELGRRGLLETTKFVVGQKMPSSSAVSSWARVRLTGLDHEELWALGLDGRQGMRSQRMIAKGGLHGLHVTVKDVLRPMIRDAASGFVLVHNHPSGDPTPSQEDIAFTQEVSEAAEAIGMPLLDHVIEAKGGWVSMLDKGLLTKPVGKKRRAE